ncbi:MAG: AraC family transcriptional regulator [Bacteroidales bacterium]|jgi:AraC-like DNA-binding protein|nr:AraC family transcriptional regulator [Bacteroidales bacterium]
MNKKEVQNLILLNAARVEHDADWNWKNVTSPFARLFFVESGSAKVIMPDGVHTIQPGYLYLIPSFVTHSYENDNFFVLYYIHVYDEHDIFDRLNFPFEVKVNEIDLLLVKRLLEINPDRALTGSDPNIYNNTKILMQTIARSEQFSFNSIVETKGILFILFARFLGQATFKLEFVDKRLVKVLRYIRDNITANISVDELSALCSLTPDHFIRMFRKEIGCTPLQYIIQKKIEKAQLLLIIDDTSIKDIAYNLSFNDIAYFSRLFKKIVGMSPNSYRTQTNGQ